jgi:phosphoglycolate phosphatase-like HAD superfamily hydrolase
MSAISPPMRRQQERLAQVADYEREFMQRYRPRAFAEVDHLLQRLRKAGLELGLVTSNTRPNVEPALGAAIEYFDKRCLYLF